MVDVKKDGGDSTKTPAIKVTGMPGKHVPDGVLGTLNDLVKAVCSVSKLFENQPTLTPNRYHQPTDGCSSWAIPRVEANWKTASNAATGMPILSPNRTSLTSARIYISGDTLMVDELKEIPKRYQGQNIDLMLIHLGGTTIPSPAVPLLMVTMDAKQGLELVRLINPDLTISIHYE